jgi:putative spermidine/putrescine transport system ATP-binding protein
VLDVQGQSLTALIPAHDATPEIGETAHVLWDPAKAHVMEAGA